MAESDEIQRLLVQRETIARLIEDENRQGRWGLAIGSVAVLAFMTWLGFALWNGAISLIYLGWAIPIALLLFFMLSRRVRVFGESATIFTIVFAWMQGVPVIDRDNELLRQQLAECDAEIAKLRSPRDRSA